MGVRDHEERLQALEKQMEYLCGLNGTAKDLQVWKVEAFDDLICADRQQLADMKFELDLVLEKFDNLTTEVLIWQASVKKLHKWVKEKWLKLK